MRKLKLLTAMAIGISASAIGSIQVEAAVYSYSVDFLDKEVANFDDYTQVFSTTTYDLNGKIEWNWAGIYYFDSCPTVFTQDMRWEIQYSAAGGPLTLLATGELPNFLCNTAPTGYSATVFADLPDTIIETLVNDDALSTQFRGIISFRNITSAQFNRTLYMEQFTNYFNVFYEFNTTYLFNYFLSDQQHSISFYPTTQGYTVGMPLAHYLEYVYTTAGNDTYLIENSLLASIRSTRKKYAINVDEVWFRGESVGAQFRSTWDGTGTGVDTLEYGTSNVTRIITHRYVYYYLNTSNYAQAIVDAPEFNFTYEDCGWDVFNIPCFINNGLAYITNDAPIISDAITLLNAGIAMAAQTFGIIGAFTTDNVFGYLILAGFGYVAVRWFLKND
jgi:hypothetical protein